MNEIKTIFSYFSGAFIAALLLVPVMRPLSFTLGALDYGTGRRIHDGIVPRLGGVGIYLAFAGPLAILLWRGSWDPAMRGDMVTILLAGTVVLAVGVYDDMRSARIRNKLAAETAAALILFAGGIRVDVLTHPFAEGVMVHLGWWSLPATILWIVVITNAINLTDGLDGLAAGTGILISATILFLTWGKDLQFSIAVIVLMGALLGFLRHNFPPATIFMGDSGSLFLGFLLGAFTIVSSAKATAMATVMVPIIAFGHPLLDMGYAVLRRYYRGVPIGEADRDHIHHRLQDLGLSKKVTLLLLYLANILIIGTVLLFVRQHFRVRVFIVVLMIALAMAGLHLLGYVELPAFLRERARAFRTNRKRRYVGYLVRRFERAAFRSRDGDELAAHLDRLASEYGFLTMTIFLTGRKEPVYSFSREQGEGDPVSLEFPLRNDRGAGGRVVVRTRAREDALLCASELMTALGRVVGTRGKLLVVSC